MDCATTICQEDPMFIDPVRRTVGDDLRQQDVRACARWRTPATLTEAAARAWVRSGCSPLCLFNRVWLALAAALQPRLNFAGVLTATRKLLQDNEAFPHTAV